MKGLIWGPAEHDTCHSPGYYFSSSMWAWRGMLELSKWLHEVGLEPAIASSLAAEALAFAADIQAALEIAVVRSNVTSEAVFVPPVAGRGQAAFGTMIESTLASYSNFRYFSEMLSARPEHNPRPALCGVHS